MVVPGDSHLLTQEIHRNIIIWKLGVRSQGDSCPRCRHRLYALWAVALAMGLRCGKALGLAWADVDLDGGRLTVWQVEGQLRQNPVKTDASVAVLPIPAPLLNILRAHRKRQLEERFAAGSRWRDTGLVFTTSCGGFIEPRNANRMFHVFARRRTCPSCACTIFAIRCATLLFTMGVQPATVQRILRHSSITVTTGTYVEVRGHPSRRSGFHGQLVWGVRRQRIQVAKCRQLSSKLSSTVQTVGLEDRILPGGARGLEPLGSSTSKYPLSCIKMRRPVPETTRKDASRPADTSKGVDAVNTAKQDRSVDAANGCSPI